MCAISTCYKCNRFATTRVLRSSRLRLDDAFLGSGDYRAASRRASFPLGCWGCVIQPLNAPSLSLTALSQQLVPNSPVHSRSLTLWLRQPLNARQHTTALTLRSLTTLLRPFLLTHLLLNSGQRVLQVSRRPHHNPLRCQMPSHHTQPLLLHPFAAPVDANRRNGSGFRSAEDLPARCSLLLGERAKLLRVAARQGPALVSDSAQPA